MTAAFAHDGRDFKPIENAAFMLDELQRFGCKTALSGNVECPACRNGLSLSVRNGPDRVELACSNGCAETHITSTLGVALVSVRRGSRTSSNYGIAPGSESLRDEPVREPVRAVRPNQKPRTSLPSFETLDSFLARTDQLPDPTWLVEDLVPESGRVHFAAAPSAGKTFLCLVVAKAAALKGRVVYLVLEEGGAKATGNRFRALRFPEGLPVLVLHQAGITLGEHAAELVAMLQRGVDGPPPVMVLDPFASVFRGDENDTAAIAGATEVLNMLMRADPRLLLIVPHHTSKAGERGDVGTPLHAGRGGTGLPGWTDVQLNLKHVTTPKGSGRVEFDALMAKNRDGERDYTIRVSIELGSGEVTFKPAGEAQREAKANDLRERIVDFVKGAEGRVTKNQICTGVKGTKTEKLKLIDELTAEGLLKNDGAGWTAKEAQ